MRDQILHDNGGGSNDQMREFRVAMSFCGEKGDVAVEVANHQIAHFGEDRVFIDANFVEEMGRPNLDKFLQGVFRDRTDLVVVLNSRGYATKVWCRTEWRAIRDLIHQGKDDVVMLMRLDDSEPPEGALSIDHFLDVSGMTPKEISDIIIKRYHRMILGNGVTRKRSNEMIASHDDRHRVEMKLPMELPDFDSGQKAVLLDSIAMLATSLKDIEGLVLVVREPGCVRVQLEMSEALAIEVCLAASHGHIGQFPVLFWRVINPGERFLAKVGASHGWNRISRREGGYWGPINSWRDLIDQAAEIIPNPFVLINIIGKRVRLLNGGRSPLIPVKFGMCAAQIALIELIEGKYRLVQRSS